MKIIRNDSDLSMPQADSGKSFTQVALAFWLPISVGVGMGFDAPGARENFLLWVAVLPIFTYPIWGIIALMTKKYRYSYIPFIIFLFAGGLYDFFS
ncbi:MAG TPA: hypothetical protein ENL09_01325 [Bacteroidetes bacterium]|nr:hypothetical protein [Bacteroidota bacterium]